MVGRWSGSWISEVNGHSGRLRCIATPIAPGRSRLHFDARYWKVFRFSYAVEFDVTRLESLDVFEGATDLGWLAGGVYHYAGTATVQEFQATYRSKHDHGVFRMKRVSFQP